MTEATEWRIIQNGLVVAGSNSLTETLRYISKYREEGPLRVETKKIGGRWKKIADLSGVQK